jgi:VIT1/CCC1 family predicted Fe2+/Mn2+ transporter
VPQIYLCKAQLTVIEEVPTSRLYISALTIGLSYFLGGLIPLLPYLFATSAEQGLIISCIVTGVVLLLFGAFKTYFTYVPSIFNIWSKE